MRRLQPARGHEGSRGAARLRVPLARRGRAGGDQKEQAPGCGQLRHDLRRRGDRPCRPVPHERGSAYPRPQRLRRARRHTAGRRAGSERHHPGDRQQVHDQPPRPVGSLRHRPRDRGAVRPAHEGVPPLRPERGEHLRVPRHRGGRRALPAHDRHADRKRLRQARSLLDAGADLENRHAPHQRAGGYHQLCDAGHRSALPRL